MLLCDVNLLVYAHRPDVAMHTEYRGWLEEARSGDEPLALVDQVLAGFIRVVTHPRVFRDPTPSPAALAFAAALRSSPATIAVQPGERTWPIFHELVTRTGAKGNAIPDAYLAAIAIDLGATFYTADRGFARFEGLRWQHPLD